jgi:DNA-binding transcriptional LysR family regulator
LNVTLAASNLGLTQSALSQRIAQLEDALEVSLFIREPRGLKLTEAGEKLLRYSSLHQSMENELLQEFVSTQTELAGTFRLAAYSSVLRSAIIPALAEFLRKHRQVQIQFQSYEMAELPQAMTTVKADAIIMDYRLGKKGVHEVVLGQEEYVVIESEKYETPADLYLDNAPEDHATEKFFASQSKGPRNLRRTFMGDVYGIIEGVETGLGRAVMSKHLILKNRHIKVLSGFNKYKMPVTLHYFEQPYYSKLAQAIFKELEQKVGAFLSPP